MDKNIKVYITGASRGLGLSLSKNLPYNIFSSTRDKGFDIEKNYDFVLNSIIESDADVFINNAYAPLYQTKLLNDVYNSWEYLNKQIINIGSCASDMDLDNPLRDNEYPKNKIDQENIIKKINVDYCVTGYKNNVKCRVTNIKMGYVNTEFPSLLDKRLFPNLDTNYVSSVVQWIIEQPSNINIREISIHSTNTPELK
jgi:hypothetical protein